MSDLVASPSTKPIGEMTITEITEWQRLLVEAGAAAMPVEYPKRPDGVIARYDRELGAVIETGADGVERVLSLRNGLVHRSEVDPAGKTTNNPGALRRDLKTPRSAVTFEIEKRKLG